VRFFDPPCDGFKDNTGTDVLLTPHFHRGWKDFPSCLTTEFRTLCEIQTADVQTIITIAKNKHKTNRNNTRYKQKQATDWLSDWLIFIENKTNVYALVTIEKLQHIRGTGKTRKIKERDIRTLEQKYKHSYKTKHNGLQSYTYLNKHRGGKDFYAILVHT